MYMCIVQWTLDISPCFSPEYAINTPTPQWNSAGCDAFHFVYIKETHSLLQWLDLPIGAQDCICIIL